MQNKESKSTSKTYDKAFYNAILKKRKKILRGYISRYGKVAWHLDILPDIQNIFLGWYIANQPIGFTTKETLCMLMVQVEKYVPAVEDSWSPDAGRLYLTILRFHNRNKVHYIKYLKLKYGGYLPKLNKTKALKEFLARGYIHVDDALPYFEKGKYSILCHTLPITWPEQFDSQQEGLAFLGEMGINGHCGCPSQDQGQEAFLKRKF